MPETGSLDEIVPQAPKDAGPLPGAMPAAPDPGQPVVPGPAAAGPGSPAGKDEARLAAAPAAAPARPAGIRPERSPYAAKPKTTWVIMFFSVLLVAALVILATRDGQRKTVKPTPLPPQRGEEKQDLSNYSAFIAQNRSLRQERAADQFLTDEAFAGEVPLAVKPGGPLIAAEIDPQLAALADALRIRVRIMLGSQSLVRGKTTTRTTRGEFRGFRVSALEKIENGAVVFEETRVESPKKALIKTVNRVLDTAQKTDLPGWVAEMRSAGLEFFPAPVPAGRSVFRGQVRPLAGWGKPVDGERTISGKRVGPIALGMPVDRMRDQLLATYIVLKRKVLVNDLYYDVYKVLDRGNEPLFYVYEKGGKVWGISIISDQFKTEKGMGIGNTLDQMRINYPIVKLASTEKKTPFIQVEDVAGIFILQGEGEKSILSILVGDSPEFE